MEAAVEQSLSHPRKGDSRMQIKTHLKNTAVKALCESMEVKTMVQLVNEILPRYDLRRRLDVRESVAVPTANAARQIVDDICRAGLFPQFVLVLARAQDRGLGGRKYRIAYLPFLVHGLATEGFVYDRENDMFIEDGRARKTPNWGVLREGGEYPLTFLRFDVSGNSALVRNNPAKKVEKTYREIFAFINAALDRRNGRLWSFQGDGGLAAFAFAGKDNAAVMCAVEALHELFLYNKYRLSLASPVHMRFAVHSGNAVYSANTESLKKGDTVKEVLDIEAKHTAADSVTLSKKVHTGLDKRLADLFAPVTARYQHALYRYELGLE
jgi:class 3 adenylate cyclase